MRLGVVIVGSSTSATTMVQPLNAQEAIRHLHLNSQIRRTYSLCVMVRYGPPDTLLLVLVGYRPVMEVRLREERIGH
jgi:hypothetical protein